MPASIVSPNTQAATALTRIEPLNSYEVFVEFADGAGWALPFLEMRYHCPCAGCVDEHTGERTVDRAKLIPDNRITRAEAVGNYAVQVTWLDGHATGIFGFDRLRALAEKFGKRIVAKSAELG